MPQTSPPPAADQSLQARRRARRLLEEGRRFPLLRALFEKLVTFAIEWLMKQLPIWLAQLDDQDDEQKA